MDNNHFVAFESVPIELNTTQEKNTILLIHNDLNPDSLGSICRQLMEQVWLCVREIMSFKIMRVCQVN